MLFLILSIIILLFILAIRLSFKIYKHSDYYYWFILLLLFTIECIAWGLSIIINNHY